MLAGYRTSICLSCPHSSFHRGEVDERSRGLRECYGNLRRRRSRCAPRRPPHARSHARASCVRCPLHTFGPAGLILLTGLARPVRPRSNRARPGDRRAHRGGGVGGSVRQQGSAGEAESQGQGGCCCCGGAWALRERMQRADATAKRKMHVPQQCPRLVPISTFASSRSPQAPPPKPPPPPKPKATFGVPVEEVRDPPFPSRRLS